MKCFQQIFLKHIKIDKTESKEKKTARNREDAGGSSRLYLGIFANHIKLSLSSKRQPNELEDTISAIPSCPSYTKDRSW